MKTERRSFFASTVAEAIAEARIQLGEDALLVETRPMAGDDSDRSGYEVVVELAASGVVLDAPDGARPEVNSVLVELSGLKRDVAHLAGLLKHVASAAYGARSDLAPLFTRLADAGFPPECSAALLDRVTRRMGYGPLSAGVCEAEAWKALTAEIESSIKTQPGLGMAAAARKVVVLAGPPGSGKTTTLAKLAVTQGVAAGVPSVLISTDTYRVAGADQLRCYAAILGLPFVQADSPASLLQALEEHRSKRLVLIDTPGYGPRELEQTGDWARFLQSRRDIEVQLVLNASMRARNLLLAAERWSELRPSRLIFTHLDEAAGYGGLISCAIDTKLPVSYLCSGQSVPEDIESASTSLLLNLAAGRPQAALAAAA